jgi:hypothetical protein
VIVPPPPEDLARVRVDEADHRAPAWMLEDDDDESTRAPTWRPSARTTELT